MTVIKSFQDLHTSLHFLRLFQLNCRKIFSQISFGSEFVIVNPVVLYEKPDFKMASTSSLVSTAMEELCQLFESKSQSMSMGGNLNI